MKAGRTRFAPLTTSILFALLAGACAPPSELDERPPASFGGEIVGDVFLDPPRNPNRPIRQALGPNGHHVIFLNFEGTTLHANYDDSTKDDSGIILKRVGHDVAYPAFNATDVTTAKSRDQVIADILALARSYYADFNVDLVTQRPTTGNYVETMIGGLPDIIGQPCDKNGCVAGLAPMDCAIDNNNKIIYNYNDDVEVVFCFSGIVKKFGGSYSSKIMSIAVTVAQETAHAYGLGHSDNMQDVMYPYETGQTTGFLSGPYADAQNCAYGKGTQDSHALLVKILGPAGQVSDLPPQVSIHTPAQGATVGRSFTVNVAVAGAKPIDTVVMTLTGAGFNNLSKTFKAAPYQWSVQATQDGLANLDVVAYDTGGKMTDAQSTFHVQGQSMGGCNCGPGYMCNMQGQCVPTMSQPQPGETGADCKSAADCKSKLCAALNGRQFCTAACDPANAASCPSGMSCTDDGAGNHVCAFAAGNSFGGGSSGCAVASAPRGAPSGELALLVLAAAALCSRRRRRG